MLFKAFVPNIASDQRITSYAQRDQVGHRRPAHKQSVGAAWKSKQSLAPVNDLPLDVDSRMVAAAAIRIHGCGQHLRYDPSCKARAVHPAEEAGMNIACSVGKNSLLELRIDIFERLAFNRQRFLQGFLNLHRHRLPYGALIKKSLEGDRK